MRRHAQVLLFDALQSLRCTPLHVLQWLREVLAASPPEVDADHGASILPEFFSLFSQGLMAPSPTLCGVNMRAEVAD